MSKWIEIPRHRVLQVTHEELESDFERVNKDGKERQEAQPTYLIIRKKDTKVFKMARYRPSTENFLYDLFFLEEI